MVKKLKNVYLTMNLYVTYRGRENKYLMGEKRKAKYIRKKKTLFRPS